MTRSQPLNVSDAIELFQLNEERWKGLLDSAPDGIISIDTAGRITLFNRGAEEIFGYTAAEVLGQNVSLLMPPPFRDEHDLYLRRYRRTGEAKAIGRVRSVQARRKNGEVFPIELSVSEARAGRRVVYTAIVRDVTERLRAAAELRQMRLQAQQRARLADIGAITAKIVHDLGNPVAALSMQAQLILRRVERGEGINSVRDAAERIVSATRRLDALIGEFLDFTREQRLDLEIVPSAPFFEEIVNHWRPVATERQITLSLDVAPEVRQLRADADKLRRVLDNLVQNAVEAVGHGPGQVRIGVQTTVPTRVRISVADSGPGIAKDIDVFRLFETTKPGGSGLGLAVARQIVLAHGGGISFASLEPHGTVFHVELPR
jgi:two-component system sensor kinase FixL